MRAIEEGGGTALPVGADVTDADAQLAPVAVVEQFAGPDGHDRAPLRLFTCGIGQHDATRRAFLLFEGFYNHSIAQGLQRHNWSLLKNHLMVLMLALTTDEC